MHVLRAMMVTLHVEANGARWPSRSSKPVAPRQRGGAGFDSQALPPLFIPYLQAIRCIGVRGDMLGEHLDGDGGHVPA